jgi:hypothetical protein
MLLSVQHQPALLTWHTQLAAICCADSLGAMHHLLQTVLNSVCWAVKSCARACAEVAVAACTTMAGQLVLALRVGSVPCCCYAVLLVGLSSCISI